jgi:hypothetical protein
MTEPLRSAAVVESWLGPSQHTDLARRGLLVSGPEPTNDVKAQLKPDLSMPTANQLVRKSKYPNPAILPDHCPDVDQGQLEWAAPSVSKPCWASSSRAAIPHLYDCANTRVAHYSHLTVTI